MTRLRSRRALFSLPLQSSPFFESRSHVWLLIITTRVMPSLFSLPQGLVSWIFLWINYMKRWSIANSFDWTRHVLLTSISPLFFAFICASFPSSLCPDFRAPSSLIFLSRSLSPSSSCFIGCRALATASIHCDSPSRESCNLSADSRPNGLISLSLFVSKERKWT